MFAARESLKFSTEISQKIDAALDRWRAFGFAYISPLPAGETDQSFVASTPGYDQLLKEDQANSENTNYKSKVEKCVADWKLLRQRSATRASTLRADAVAATTALVGQIGTGRTGAAPAAGAPAGTPAGPPPLMDAEYDRIVERLWRGIVRRFAYTADEQPSIEAGFLDGEAFHAAYIAQAAGEPSLANFLETSAKRLEPKTCADVFARDPS